MGNTHGDPRRKSRTGSEIIHSSVSASGDYINTHHRRASGNMFSALPQKGLFEDGSGPLSIQAEGDSKYRNYQAHRPRATTEVGRHSKVTKQRSNDIPTQFSFGIDEDGEDGSKDGKSVDKFGKPMDGRPTIFKYSGHAKEVYVCGTFNGWKKLPMSRSTKDFVAIVDLKEGEHEYKFLVDGEWRNDPNSSEKVERDGFKNNVIRVQKEDFNAYDALDMDSAAVSKLHASKRLKNGVSSASEEYGQEVPSSGSVFEHRGGPPILPPHLLQVILNKDTPLSCEPTLLPEPNHVMLNHLYALSIKDGVMVLSSTQRYKKKYVTTLLYKPMGSRKD